MSSVRRAQHELDALSYEIAERQNAGTWDWPTARRQLVELVSVPVADLSERYVTLRRNLIRMCRTHEGHP